MSIKLSLKGLFCSLQHLFGSLYTDGQLEISPVGHKEKFFAFPEKFWKCSYVSFALSHRNEHVERCRGVVEIRSWLEVRQHGR